MSAAEYRAYLAQPRDAKQRPSKPRPSPRPKIKGVERVAERPTFLAAITRLMNYEPSQRLRLKKEEELSVAFANTLRELTLSGRLCCVWTHPANEIAGRQDRLAQIRYTIAKAMGLISGTADFLFLWRDGSAALEAKVGNSGQQPNQVDFEIWCDEMGVPYFVFTSIDEGVSLLTSLGVVAPPPPV